MGKCLHIILTRLTPEPDVISPNISYHFNIETVTSSKLTISIIRYQEFLES
jgi:hypothetical protein